jgi:acetyl-CoA acetyltransferase family protein
MGQHMEITAKQLKIARAKQDEIAYKSHANAAKAMQDGLLQKDIAPLGGVDRDLIVRGDTTVEKLAKLRPVFDRSEHGTLTAGNSSALTDGASSVLLMGESEVRRRKLEPLAYIADYEYAAIDANDGLLMAPGVAVPRLLKRNGFTFDDFDLIEVHEAFAAQVLANIQVWEQGGAEAKIGAFPFDKLNTLGGSLAIGHPFAATGGRIITTLAREMQRKNLKRGLVSICAAGAMAAAVILER